MWRQLRAVAIASGIFAMSFSPMKIAAAESKGFYGDFRAGVMLLQDADNDAGSVVLETSYDPGYAIALAVGYDFGDFRFEGEIFSREADVDDTKTNGVTVNGDGNAFAAGGMVNAYYDFDLGSPWTPYVGAGLGAAVVGFENWRAAGIDLADDEDLVFAFQGAAGLGYEFNDRFAVYGGYRFFGTTDPSLEDDAGDDFDSEFYSHTIELGFRYIF